MIFPGGKNLKENSHSKKSFNSFEKDQSDRDLSKKDYYEVGCKIFEINKFYKKD